MRIFEWIYVSIVVTVPHNQTIFCHSCHNEPELWLPLGSVNLAHFLKKTFLFFQSGTLSRYFLDQFTILLTNHLTPIWMAVSKYHSKHSVNVTVVVLPTSKWKLSWNNCIIALQIMRDYNTVTTHWTMPLKAKPLC